MRENKLEGRILEFGSVNRRVWKLLVRYLETRDIWIRSIERVGSYGIPERRIKERRVYEAKTVELVEWGASNRLSVWDILKARVVEVSWVREDISSKRGVDLRESWEFKLIGISEIQWGCLVEAEVKIWRESMRTWMKNEKTLWYIRDLLSFSIRRIIRLWTFWLYLASWRSAIAKRTTGPSGEWSTEKTGIDSPQR